jgi:putative flippase GtrA
MRIPGGFHRSPRLASVVEGVMGRASRRLRQFAGWFVLGVIACAAEVVLIGLLRQGCGWPLWLASAVAAEAVLVARFLSTDRFVFGYPRPAIERGLRFQSAAVGSFAASWLVLNAVATLLHVHYAIAVLCGSLAAFCWSALTNFCWVWRPRRVDAPHARPARRTGVQRLAWLAGVGVLALVAPTNLSASVQPAPAIAPLPAPGEPGPGRPILTADGVYLPASVDAARPVSILLALHGYAGSGPAIAGRLRGCADRYGWIVVAPSMVYRDYFDPAQLRTDAQQNLPSVHDLVEQVRAAVSGLELQPRLLVYGFSRGAQMAHRFSMLYPSDVAAVATLSAGSYTLPEAEDTSHQVLRFPFGVADLQILANTSFDRQAFSLIPFWVGVGAQDNNPDDTSRAWDAYEGQTRVDRARAFAGELRNSGGSVELRVFGQAGHEETGSMRLSACAFLAAHASSPDPE